MNIVYKNKNHSFTCEAGKPLHFDTIGNVPKKVRKAAEKAWRKLNPPRDGFASPRITSRYTVMGPLAEWFRSKVGAQ